MEMAENANIVNWHNDHSA